MKSRAVARSLWRKLQADARPDCVVIGERHGLDTGCERLQIADEDPVQVTAKRGEGVESARKRHLETVMLHRGTDGGPMRWASGNGHEASQPVKLIGVEVACDETWSGAAGRRVDDGLKLLETFRGVDASVEMSVPDTHAAPRGAHGGGHGKTVSLTEAEVAGLEALDLDIVDGIAAHKSEALVMDTGRGGLKVREVSETAGGVFNGTRVVVSRRDLLEEKQVGVAKPRSIAHRIGDNAGIAFFRHVERDNREGPIGSGVAGAGTNVPERPIYSPAQSTASARTPFRVQKSSLHRLSSEYLLNHLTIRRAGPLEGSFGS